ncbi:Outer membrane protein TOM13 [Rhizoctonia solani]|uniref:Outer membrane protein TOM13 n=1 Tax=Rhizoctonia solani TaxID=456999 RepID=A0A8H7IBS1_9AGAM|nr:Outer membrane protein TOM13 [Rhizoctonia solani]
MSSMNRVLGGLGVYPLARECVLPVDVPVHPFRPPTPPPPAPVNNLADEASSAPASDPIADSWKDEYDARVATWRAESAEARTKAEAERAKWEELRASGHVPEHETWETVGSSVAAESDVTLSESTGTGASVPGTNLGGEAHGSIADQVNAPPVTSVADARDLVSGEKDGGNGADVLAQSTLGYPPSAASIRTLETEDVDASPVNLSGAELSAGEGTTSSYSKKGENPSSSLRHSHNQPAPTPPPSLTLSVFDSSLPTRTRVIALFSSLAINMFLPFVNGVMLGFGEIFARNVIGPWFGWPKPVATSVGVRAGKDKKRS